MSRLDELKAKFEPDSQTEVVPETQIQEPLQEATQEVQQPSRLEELKQKFEPESSEINQEAPLTDAEVAQYKDIPELQQLTDELLFSGRITDAFQLAVGSIASSDDAQKIDIIKKIIPSAKIKTVKGITTVDAKIDGESKQFVINRPGASPRDVLDFAGELVKFFPAAKWAQIPKLLKGKIAVGSLASFLTSVGFDNLANLLGSDQEVSTSRAVGAGLVGGGSELILPAVRAIRGAKPSSLEETALGTKTSTQEEVDAFKASNLRAEEETGKTGIQFFPAQKMEDPTQLGVQKFLAKSYPTQKKAYEAFSKQNKEAQEAVTNLLNEFAPPQGFEESARAVQKSAKSLVQATKDFRRNATSPHYTATFKELNKLPEESLNSLKTRTLEKLQELKQKYDPTHPTRVALEKFEKSVVKSENFQQLHGAKSSQDLEILSMEANLLGKGSSPIASMKQALNEANTVLRADLKEFSPRYKEITEEFDRLSPAVNSILESPIGKIANIPDNKLEGVSNIIFNSRLSDKESVKAAKDALYKENPEVWNGFVRKEAERRISTMKDDLADMTDIDFQTANIPKLLRDALFGRNNTEREVFKAALPDEALKNFEWLNKALQRASRGRTSGEAQGGRDVIKESIQGIGIGIRLYLKQPLFTMISTGEKKAFDNRAASIADIMFDPKYAPELAAIRKLNPTSEAAFNALNQALNRALTDVESRTREVEAEPTKEEVLQRVGSGGGLL